MKKAAYASSMQATAAAQSDIAKERLHQPMFRGTEQHTEEMFSLSGESDEGGTRGSHDDR